MTIIEQRQQFPIDDNAAKINRSDLKSWKTAILVILDSDKNKAEAQLKFRWRGLTRFICVVGPATHPFSRVEITKMITDAGGGYLPAEFFLDDKGRNCTTEHSEWFVSLITDSKVNLKNIIVNCVDDFPFMLEKKLRITLPKKYGEINFYHTAVIKSLRR